MHKDAPPGLFDIRRPIAHVIVHGAIVGFIIACVAHFGWRLWRHTSERDALSPISSEAYVSGINPPRSSPGANPNANPH